MPEPRNILVKEVNWLGDVVMSLPALRAVRRAYPLARLSVLIKRELASFFDGAEWVDEVIPYRIGSGVGGVMDRRRVVGTIRAGRFDLAVLLPRSFEAAFWTTLARVPRRVGFEADGRGLMLTDKTPYVPERFPQHQSHDYLHMLHETLGIDGDAEDFVPDVYGPHRQTVATWLGARRRQADSRLIALAPAAAFGPAKEWMPDRFAALIDVLGDRWNVECVLVGAPAERARCEAVAATSRRGAMIAAGELNVGEAMALLAACDGFAGNDSGAMHIAGALGIPTVGIYGSTRPNRTGPLGPRTRIVYHQIECSPCMDRTCRFGHYECLKRITVEEVAQTLVTLAAW